MESLVRDSLPDGSGLLQGIADLRNWLVIDIMDRAPLKASFLPLSGSSRQWTCASIEPHDRFVCDTLMPSGMPPEGGRLD